MIIFTDTSYNNHNLCFPDSLQVSGHVEWQSPANIALIKYWGKHGRQLPMNPSFSFSLKNSLSQTGIEYKLSEDGFKYKFLFNGKRKPAFEPKLNSFFENILPIFPFLNQLELKIESLNTFPHSSGLASSASGISALALCLCSIEKKEFNKLKHPEDFYRKASFVARLGSGSAARSVYGGFVNWGKIDRELGSSDFFANKYPLQIDNIFSDLQDTIILIGSGEKKISSSKGHGLMENHDYADARYIQAKINYKEMVRALRTGNLIKFIEIVENEALSLHALMMSSRPGYFLIKPQTLEFIEKIRIFRKETNIPVCFTLDAGPNLHILYPAKNKKEVIMFISSELLDKNNDVSAIYDKIGTGPEQIKNSKP